MLIALHQTRVFREWSFVVGASKTDVDRGDGLDAIRGILTGLFISTLFWTATSLAL